MSLGLILVIILIIFLLGGFSGRFGGYGYGYGHGGVGIIGIILIVYCSPVLRHPAGLIQAANFRSAIAF
jgi:Na+/melibiose symporter-like transporter